MARVVPVLASLPAQIAALLRPRLGNFLQSRPPVRAFDVREMCLTGHRNTGPEVDTIARFCHGNERRDRRAVMSIAPFAWRQLDALNGFKANR